MLLISSYMQRFLLYSLRNYSLCFHTISNNSFHIFRNTIRRFSGNFIINFICHVWSAIQFYLGTLLPKSFLHNQRTDSFDAFQKMFIKNGIFYLFAIRMIPVFPFYLVNIFMAFTPIKLVPYSIVTFIGITPMTIIYVYFGSQINTISHISEILSPQILIIFCLIGLTPLILRYVFNYFFRK